MRNSALVLQPGDRQALELLVTTADGGGRLAVRARIVLALADGATVARVADLVNVSAPTVRNWRRQYEAAGVPGLGAVRGPGTTPEVERILRAAETTLSDRGFCAIRLADIAEAAGVAPPTVVYHFGTRQRVLVQSMLFSSERAAADLDEALAGDADPFARVALLIDRFVPYAGPNRREFLLELDLLAHARQYPELLELWEEYQRRWLAAIVAVIEDGSATGVFSPVTDIRTLSQLLLAVVDGLGYQIAVGSGQLSVLGMRTLLVDFVAAQLGIGPDRIPRSRVSP